MTLNSKSAKKNKMLLIDGESTFKERAKFRKSIREHGIKALLEIGKTHKLYLESSWGPLPVEDILINRKGILTCLFYRHGLRSYRNFKELAAKVYFVELSVHDDCTCIIRTNYL